MTDEEYAKYVDDVQASGYKYVTTQDRWIDAGCPTLEPGTVVFACTPGFAEHYLKVTGVSASTLRHSLVHRSKKRK